MTSKGDAGGDMMDEELIRFASFLENERQMAKNTLVSYERDLRQMISWMAGRGVTESGKVTETLLASYVLWLERQGKATTTISRVVASMKSFFAYEQKQGIIGTNPAEGIKAPKVEKKAPTIMTAEEVEAFLAQTRGKTLKKIRDRAMMELLCATGLRVSELIDLKVQDLNFQIVVPESMQVLQSVFLRVPVSAHRIWHSNHLYCPHAHSCMSMFHPQVSGRRTVYSNSLYCLHVRSCRSIPLPVPASQHRTPDRTYRYCPHARSDRSMYLPPHTRQMQSLMTVSVK